MSSSSYKIDHEQFTTNRKGTSIACIVLCLAHAPACLLIAKLVQWKRKPNYVRDYIFLVIPILLSISFLHNHSYWSLPCLLSVGFVASKLQRESIEKHGSIDTDFSGLIGPTKTYLTYFKGLNMILTCLSILAVDFKVFPRRFAKTELFGIGLMDIGVGTFIISSAFTSKFARGIDTSKLPLSSILSTQRILVLCIGVLRTVVVKMLTYQSKVTEYGVHWNFFLTLVSVWCITDVVHRVFSRIASLILAVLTIIIYQWALLHTLLVDYVITAPRTTSFFAANREGIISLIGFVCMYLIAEALAFYVFFDGKLSYTLNDITSVKKMTQVVESSDEESASSEIKANARDATVMPVMTRWRCLTLPPVKATLNNLIVICLCLFGMGVLCTSLQPTSRRLCNASYILLVLFISVLLVILIIIADVVGGLGVRCLTVEYFSKHQLLVFLIANLSTGAINMSMQTMYAPAQVAAVVLMVYAAAITGIAWGLTPAMRLVTSLPHGGIPQPMESTNEAEVKEGAK